MSKIAVIGGGMAGLTAARILKDAGNEVYVFEAMAGKGMDSHSLNIEGGIIDSPLRVMNPLLWENTLALANYVGINMFQVNTYMSCNWLESKENTLQRTKTWLTTSRAKYRKLPLLGDWNLGKNHIISLFKGWLDFRSSVDRFLKLPQAERQSLTLAQFMNRYHINDKFWHGCMMPVLYTLCTCDEKTLGEWPAEPLLGFLLKMQQGSPLLRMYGGTAGFVEALSDDLSFYSGSKVTEVRETENHVEVKNANGIHLVVDKVIIATPTHILDFLDAEKFSKELHILKQYKFIQGDLVIHTDPNCMPVDKAHWTTLSYCMDQNYKQHMFTVWLNAVEPSLCKKTDIFQTWNPTISINKDKIIDRVRLTRAVVDQNTLNATAQMRELQKTKDRKVYFCGSWMCEGLPILESAVTSAMFVTEQMGAKVNFKGLKPKIIPAQELQHVMAK